MTWIKGKTIFLLASSYRGPKARCTHPLYSSVEESWVFCALLNWLCRQLSQAVTPVLINTPLEDESKMGQGRRKYLSSSAASDRACGVLEYSRVFSHQDLWLPYPVLTDTLEIQGGLGLKVFAPCVGGTQWKSTYL